MNYRLYVNGTNGYVNYFLNNNNEKVYYKDVILRIKVTIADGQSKDTAIRIYSADELRNIDTRLYYRIMNDLELTNWTQLTELRGMIFGNDENITLTMSGQSLIGNLYGTVKNLTFVGAVNGGGFVADNVLSGGVIENVKVDVRYDKEKAEYIPSVVSGGYYVETSLIGNYIGAIAGRNEGLITSCYNYGANLTASLENGSSVAGGIVGYLGGLGILKNAYIEDAIASIGMVAGFMFGGIGLNAEVRDITYTYENLENYFIRASAYGGVIVGDLKGVLRNVSVLAPQIEDEEQQTSYYIFVLTPKVPLAVGGLSGIVRGNATQDNNLIDCSVGIDIVFNQAIIPNSVGGLVGRVVENVAITNCEYTGSLITGRNAVGGFIGEIYFDNTFGDVNLTNVKIGTSELKSEIRAVKPAQDETSISSFVGGIVCSKMNPSFNEEYIKDFIDDVNTIGLDYWDIVFQGGESETHFDIEGLEELTCAGRAIHIEHNAVVVSSRRRLLNTSAGKLALSEEQIAKAVSACKAKWEEEGSSIDRTIPSKAYFEHLPNRKPILIVMLIVPKPPKENEDEEQKLIKFRSDLGQSYIAAFAMGFPGVKGVDKAKHYKVNKVYYTQNLMDEPEELDDEDE